MVKLVIFDLDGTLLNSTDAILESFRLAAEALGLDIDLEEVRRSLGMPSRAILERSLRSAADEGALERFLELRRELHNQLVLKCELFEDAVPTLRDLRSRGLLLALASSNRRGRLEAVLERHGLSALFDAVVSYEDVRRGKPHPDMVLKVLEELGVRPDEAVMVGDAESDVLCARRAGVRAVLIDRSGSLSHVGEDFRVRSLRELVELIDSLDC